MYLGRTAPGQIDSQFLSYPVSHSKFSQTQFFLIVKEIKGFYVAAYILKESYTILVFCMSNENLVILKLRKPRKAEEAALQRCSEYFQNTFL